MKAPLFRSKLYRPVARAELVARTGLFDRLTAGLSSKLILVSAPAGYGKSTLLSAWAANSRLPVAWLSLDEHDNDPERFLAYLVAAVQNIGAISDLDMFQPGPGSLQSFQPVHLEDLMLLLISQLDLLAKSFVLILDDYHAIKNPEIHKAVAFLIDYQPPHMHLAITTREDPPLPISRLRARGQLAELRQADLRFTPEETAAYLSQWGSLKLPPQEVAVLAGRTEGWVAGLQMATLALQRALDLQRDPELNREEISRIIASFGGGHEYIIDYFSAEVFAQQSVEVRMFLLQTSILDRLCGSLCEAVTGQPNGQQMLEWLYKANLFVIALDQERHWYRYHHLFCDLLRKNLRQQSPEILPELNRRASLWYEEHEMIDQAFQHAQAAGDQERIGWIIDEYSEALWMRGEYTTLQQWINALTPEQLEARGEIANGKAMILAMNGNFDEAEQIWAVLEHYLADRIAAGDQGDLSTGLNQVRQPGHLLGLVAAAHAQMAVVRGDPQAVLYHSRQALDILSKYNLPWDIPWKCQILIAMSDAHLLISNIPAAIQELTEAIHSARAYHHDALLLEALTKLAIDYWLQGNLIRAGEVCEEGLSHIAQNNLGNMPIAAGLRIASGWVQTERNELETALDDLLKGLRLSRSSNLHTDEYLANAALLRYWCAKGDLETAETFIHPAENLRLRKKIPAWLEITLTGVKLLLWLKQGRMREVDQELLQRGIFPEGEICHPEQALYYARARLSLVQGDFSAASQILDNLFSFAQAAGQKQWILLVLITRSLIFLQQQNMGQALQALAIAVDQAAQEEYVQVFVDEGEPIARLLDDLLLQQPGCQQPGVLFVHRLQQAFTQKTFTQPLENFTGLPNRSADSDKQPDRKVPLNPAAQRVPDIDRARGASNMLEPLSARELEILSLIAEGLSNQQIASRLYLTLRTVKFHASNIYSKLDVESRTEAVAKARQRKLIP